MRVTIIGKPSKIHSSLIHEAAVFYTTELIRPRLSSKLSVCIFFKKGMLKDEGLEATCVWEDRNIRTREFTIHLDKDMSKRKLLISLAHELVHVKQYATGEMKQYLRRFPDVSWMGKFVNTNELDYNQWPWEIEAWDMEHSLYQKFVRHMKETRHE